MIAKLNTFASSRLAGIMPPRFKTILNSLFRLPWWVYVLLASVAYIGLKYIAPSIQTENVLLSGIGRIGPTFAPYVALIFLLPAPFSLYER